MSRKKENTPTQREYKDEQSAGGGVWAPSAERLSQQRDNSIPYQHEAVAPAAVSGSDPGLWPCRRSWFHQREPRCGQGRLSEQ